MNELLTSGLQLMGVGMGIVFLFLGLLVGIVSLVSRVIQSFEEQPATTTPGTQTQDDDLMQVITEAVKRYREEHYR